jgi:hypothetical protein
MEKKSEKSMIYQLPKNSSWNFEQQWTEPLFSPNCVFLKRATYKDATITVKRIKEKYCAVLQFGSGELILEGAAIFGATNEKDAISAVEEASIKMKIAKREQ